MKPYNHKQIESKWPHFAYPSPKASERHSKATRGKPSSAKASEGRGNSYDHKQIESKWQEIWKHTKLNQPDLVGAKKPFYNLMMYPYPSAEGLHVGNMYAFTGADIYGRFKRMQGFDVFEPIGFDSGGIHSENFAIKMGAHPRIMTERNVANFTKQLHRIGCMYDWAHAVDAMDPGYYKWTQWIFVQLFKAGLAYKKEAPVTWCPSCKTTVSDEQTEKRTVDSKQLTVNRNQKKLKTENWELKTDEVVVCERCKTPVEKRKMNQWFFKITDYAERLLENTEKLNWSEKVLIAQRNWIGKSEGIDIEYEIEGHRGKKVVCFTTRPDTNFGATFIVIAPEHPLVDQITTEDNKTPVSNYVRQALAKNELERIAEGREKSGVFTGTAAMNNLTGKKMPIWVSDFVLGHVGTGAVVGVPGHDLRDFEFAKKFNLPVKRVVIRDPERCRSFLMGAESISDQELQEVGIEIIKKAGSARKLEFAAAVLPAYQRLVRQKLSPGYWNEVIGEDVWFCFKSKSGKTSEYILSDENQTEIAKKCSRLNNDPFEKTSNLWLYLAENDWYQPFIVQEEDGVMVNSGFLNGLDIHEATQKIMDYLEEKRWGRRTVAYRLRDWCISRQRYWGPPIPMIECVTCGWQPVPEEDLPVELPEIKDYLPDGSGKAPLAKHPEFYETWCPNCGGQAQRETDVSDTFLDSSWYFLAYPNRGTKEFERNTTRRGTDPYQGPSLSKKDNRPFNASRMQKWLPVDQYTGGAEHSVLHLMYSRFITMALHDLGYLEFEEPFPNFYAHGLIIKDGAKMSKSRGNVVNPDEYIEKYGADALRMYLMFIGPFSQGGDFRDTGMKGMYRFVKKVYGLAMRSIARTVAENAEDGPLHSVWRELELERTTQKMAKDFGRFKYNTAIARLMEFVNVWSDSIDKTGPKVAARVAILLTPLAPHLAEEIWQMASNQLSVDSKQLSVGKGEKTENWKLSTGNFNSVHQQLWPQVDFRKLEEEMVTIIIQVNGKKRGGIRIKNQKSKIKNEVEVLVRENKKVTQYLAGKSVKKTIFVPGKLVNFVVG